MKVIIVEDNLFSQRALETKLSGFSDIEIVKIAQSGYEIITLLKQNNDADIILMDIEMPVMNGIEATRIIKNSYPHLKIIMITIFDDDTNIFNAICAGADSYLLKEAKAENIYQALHDTLNGGAVMSPSIASKALNLLRKQPDISKSNEELNLSKTEIKVLEQLCKGLKYKEIADILSVSMFTVKNHVSSIYRKLHVQNRIDLLNTFKKKTF